MGYIYQVTIERNGARKIFLRTSTQVFIRKHLLLQKMVTKFLQRKRYCLLTTKFQQLILATSRIRNCWERRREKIKESATVLLLELVSVKILVSLRLLEAWRTLLISHQKNVRAKRTDSCLWMRGFQEASTKHQMDKLADKLIIRCVQNFHEADALLGLVLLLL